MSDKELLLKLGFDESAIPEQRSYNGLPFPLVVRPAAQRNAEEWYKIIRENQQDMEQLVRKYGSILFIDFPIENPECFDKFAASFGWGHFPYLGGPAPRKNIVGNVYTSNEAPPDKYMSFHHEMRYQNHIPDWVFFYCDIQPVEGGETPVAMSYPIYEDMLKKEPEFVEKLAKEGLYYTRVQPSETDDSTIISGSWQESYFTNSKEEIEKTIRSHGGDIEWLEDNCARISSKLEAFGTDSVTGKKTWFNNALAYYLGYVNQWNKPRSTIFFGNGDPIPEKAMETLKAVMEDHAVDYKWVKGRVIVMDNYRVLHSRRTFKPPRRILASLCK